MQKFGTILVTFALVSQANTRSALRWVLTTLSGPNAGTEIRDGNSNRLVGGEGRLDRALESPGFPNFWRW